MIIYGGSFKFWIPSGFNTSFGSHLKEIPPRTCLLVIGRQLLKGIQYDLRIALGLGPFGGATTVKNSKILMFPRSWDSTYWGFFSKLISPIWLILIVYWLLLLLMFLFLTSRNHSETTIETRAGYVLSVLWCSESICDYTNHTHPRSTQDLQVRQRIVWLYQATSEDKSRFNDSLSQLDASILLWNI